jgi:hypothetical protein
MNPLIIPAASTENLSEMIDLSSSIDEEQQLASDEQLMLDREAYAHGFQY